jgi:hypothetical protein
MRTVGSRRLARTVVGVAIVGLAWAFSRAAAQMPQATYARAMYHRVAAGMGPEFERFMRDEWKPIYAAERQNGRLVNWMLYRLHLGGDDDEFNYVAVRYDDSWAKTEASASWADVVRRAAPQRAPAIVTRTRALGPIVRQALYQRLDVVTRSAPVPFRYAVMDFMKVRPGMIDEYLEVEREDWKPLHQVLTDEGNRVGWALWDYLVPGGTGSDHDFMTAMLFTDYASIKAANDGQAYLKAHPGKNLQASVARTRASRDVVRTEIWEVVDSLH